MTVVIGLLLYFFVFKSLYDPFEVVPRVEWTNDRLIEGKFLSLPLKRIIVGQIDEIKECSTKEDCIQRVKEIKAKNSDLQDIPWNFLIGGDGRVYEGRGYKFEGEHSMDVNASDYNDIGIGIGFIGNFTNYLGVQLIETLEKFIKKSIDEEILSLNYLIFLQDKLVYKKSQAESLEIALNGIKNYYDGKILI